MTQYVDEFREWMLYLAGRDHVSLVAVRLHLCLADELGRAGMSPVPPRGYPQLTGDVLISGAVGALAQVAGSQGWKRAFERSWRKAAELAGEPDPEAWGDRFGFTFVLSLEFVRKMARLRSALGPDSRADPGERERAVCDASATMFRRLWEDHADDLLKPGFRDGFCKAVADDRQREADETPQAPRLLSLQLRTWLRDGGSPTLIEKTPPKKLPPGGEPIITTLLCLSSRVILRCRIARMLATGMAEADAAAALLLRVEPEQGDTAALAALAKALSAPGADKAELRRRINAAAADAAADPRECQAERAHALEVLALCRGDDVLPQAVETVEEYLRRFGGAMEPMLTGTRVRRIITLLRLSSRVTLRCRIARVLGRDMEAADAAAALLFRLKPAEGDADALAALAAALSAPGKGKAELRQRIAARAAAVGAAADLRERRFTRAHALEVLALCRGDGDLPQTVETVEDYLRRFSGAAEVIVGLDEPLGAEDNDGSLGDMIAAADTLPYEVDALDDVCFAAFGGEAFTAAFHELFDRVFPDRVSRLRGALLLGLPSLLPADVLPTTRLLAERGPPKGEAAWALLARLLNSHPAALRREAQELRRRLGGGKRRES